MEKKIAELNQAVKLSKKQSQNANNGIHEQLREKSSEIEVLKEMVRGAKL